MKIEKSVLSVLRKARRILAKPERWITGLWGANKKHTETFGSDEVCDPDAYCFCLEGAVYRAACKIKDEERRDEASMGALAALASNITAKDPLSRFTYGVVSYNDSYAGKFPLAKGHALILKLLDRTIAKLEKQVAA